MNFSTNQKLFSVSTENHEKFKEYFWIKENPTKIEKKLYEKTEKYLKYISWIPGIKMIWIWNSIAMNCATKYSDIDLYVVTDPNRMWFVRVLMTVILQVLWVRITKNNHADRFCLSFFSTTNAINFWKFALQEDIYLYFWIIYFKPIFDKDNTYNNFLEQNNSWMDTSEYFQIISDNKKYIKHSKKNHLKISSYYIISKIIPLIDRLLEKIYFQKTYKHYVNIWKPYGFIINKDLLKLHDTDVRKEIIKILK